MLREGYRLSDIGLVVRQRAAYSETIARVLREESLPCNLETRVDVNDIPALRAALKLFAASWKPDSRRACKSACFRVGRSGQVGILPFEPETNSTTSPQDSRLRVFTSYRVPAIHKEIARQVRKRYRVGVWDADALENTFAYVGSELPLSEWLRRAERLIKMLPGAAMRQKNSSTLNQSEQARDPDEADQVENAETAKLDEKNVEKKRRPSRDVHPASIFWAALVIEEFTARIQAVPLAGGPAVCVAH